MTGLGTLGRPVTLDEARGVTAEPHQLFVLHGDHQDLQVKLDDADPGNAKVAYRAGPYKEKLGLRWYGSVRRRYYMCPAR
jgi:hypothetical protein